MTPDQPARDRDRDAASALVRDACARGRIVELDRDMRLQQIEDAQTHQEIDLVVRDLRPDAGAQWTGGPPSQARVDPAVGPPATFPPPYAGAGSVPPPPPPPPYGAAVTRTATGVSCAGCLVPAVIGVFVLVIGFIILVASIDVGDDVATDDGIATSPTYPPGVAPDQGGLNVLTEQGYADLVAAVEEERGTRDAFMAVLYPTYAVVTVPADADSGRQESLYWDGDLAGQGSTGTSPYERFDLADVDLRVVVRLVKRVRRTVEDPTSWYAILRGPDADGATIWAYASNEHAETAYIAATPTGRITFSSGS